MLKARKNAIICNSSSLISSLWWSVKDAKNAVIKWRNNIQKDWTMLTLNGNIIKIFCWNLKETVFCFKQLPTRIFHKLKDESKRLLREGNFLIFKVFTSIKLLNNEWKFSPLQSSHFEVFKSCSLLRIFSLKFLSTILHDATYSHEETLGWMCDDDKTMEKICSVTYLDLNHINELNWKAFTWMTQENFFVHHPQLSEA